MAWAGALHPRGLSPLLAGGAVLGALLARRRLLVLVAVAALASGLSAAAWSGLAPVVPGRFSGVVTLVRDPAPAPVGSGLTADVRLPGGGRVELVDPHPGSDLAARLAGERLQVEGRLLPFAGDQPWSVPRHLRGRLVADRLVPAGAGGVLSRSANAVRRTLDAGAENLPEGQRALFTGMVVGDDRQQSAEQADAFRAAGLSHLLAVSGQNVAFVLLVVEPLLSRLQRRGRLIATVGVLVLFTWITRAEPSVLRAVAMAGIAAAAVAAGRRGAGLQILGLAVAALVLVDPLLVRSLGFQLSVAASGGIIVAAGAASRLVPGPRPLARVVGVTVAAQGAVAPLLLSSFGGLPAAALPANVAAAPAAGPLTAWGLTGGLLAGLLPAGAAHLLHMPTTALLWWIDGVAHLAVRIPAGALGWAHVGVLGALAAALWLWRTRLVRVLGVVGALVVLVHPAVSLGGHPPGHQPLATGADLWRDGGAVVVSVDGRARPATVLAALRDEGVTDVDLLVDRTGRAEAVVRELRLRYGQALTAVPAGSTPAPPGALVIRGPTSVPVGDQTVRLAPGGSGLEMGTAGPAGGS